MGAFCTLLTYAVMGFNLVVLFTAFQDGSNQSDSALTTFIDHFDGDNYNLSDNLLEIVIFSDPPLPENIARWKIEQNQNGEMTEVGLVPCSEQVTKKSEEYWIPRIGDEYFDEIRDSIMCTDTNQLNLQGDFTFTNASSLVKISIELCVSNPLINIEDCEIN